METTEPVQGVGAKCQDRKRTTRVLLAAVCIDYTAIALVLPVLNQRWMALDGKPELYGVMMSVFGIANQVGNIIGGVVGDRQLGWRIMMIISFSGAAVSYTFVGLAQGVWTIVISRAIVGFFKRTFTAATALLTECTTPGAERSAALGRLQAVTSVPFMFGPAIGGKLYAVHHALPGLVAASMYAVNIAFVLCCLDVGCRPSAAGGAAEATGLLDALRASFSAVGMAALTISLYTGGLGWVCGRAFEEALGWSAEAGGRFASGLGMACIAGGVLRFLMASSTRASLKRVCARPMVAHVGIATITMTSVGGVLGVMTHLYEQRRFELDSTQMGYLQSASAVFGFVNSCFLIGPIVQRLGSSHCTLHVGALLVLLSLACEAMPAFPFAAYAVLVMPLKSLAGNMIGLAMKDLFTATIPPEDMGMCLSMLSSFQNVAGLVTPLVGGALFGRVTAPTKQALVSLLLNSLAATVLHVLFPVTLWPRRLWLGRPKDKDQ